MKDQLSAYRKTLDKFKNRFKPKTSKLSESLEKDLLIKALFYKGSWRPEASDPDGMVHPDRPYVKQTGRVGPSWAHNPHVAAITEKGFLNNFNSLYSSNKLSPAGKKSLLGLAKAMADDPDRHLIGTDNFGTQELRMRHFSQAMAGKPGYSIHEMPGGEIHIHAQRHSNNPQNQNEAHAWSYHPDNGLKFLGNVPMSQSGGDSDGKGKFIIEKQLAKLIRPSGYPVEGSLQSGEVSDPKIGRVGGPIRPISGQDAGKGTESRDNPNPLEENPLKKSHNQSNTNRGPSKVPAVSSFFKNKVIQVDNMKKSYDDAYKTKKEKKEPPTLDYSKMNKPQTKPSGPDVGQYWKTPDVKHSDILKEKQMKDKQMERHSKNPEMKIVTGKNKTDWAVKKSEMPSYKESCSSFKERYSKLQKNMDPNMGSLPMGGMTAPDTNVLRLRGDTVKKSSDMGMPMGSPEVEARRIRGSNSLAMSNTAHPAGSLMDGSHDVIEGAPLKAELAQQDTNSKRSELLQHLRTLKSSGKLRSQKNQEIGKD